MADAGQLPSPDYVSAADDDLTLRMPTVIHYDEWRSASHKAESLPLPPAHLLVEDDDEAFPEPPPDYDAEMMNDKEYPGLIPPHKLPNPVLDSRDRVQLNRDIKFNAKHGVNVLNTKPELEKELERRKIDRQKKELAEQQRKNRNSFEQKLDLQRERINSQEQAEQILEEDENQSELARIRNKIKGKTKESQ